MKKTELAQVIDRRNTLYARIDVLSTMDTDPTIQAIKLEYAEEMTRLDNLINEKREYLYNFKSGGWNSEYALTEEDAIAQAQARFADMDIDEKSFRVSTPADYQNCLSLFY